MSESLNNIETKIQEDISPTKRLSGFHLKIVGYIAIIWSLFQLWYASPFPFMLDFGMFKGLPARAIHLGFALLLAFLIFPIRKNKNISVFDIFISLIALFCCLYIYFFYDQLVDRGGVLLTIQFGTFEFPLELVIGSLGIFLLLEATRRVIGKPLVIIAVCFLLFSYFGKYAPEIISHGGLSLKRLVGFQWFDQEAIFGIPIGVSVDFIFLFVLFGAFLETAGGGRYFLDLAFALVGKSRGGPAKAAILGSGMTGMISGSSVANTVTTGTFTIPIMKQTGFSKEKAGAIEVSSSVNGQIMPPVMGAAAFVMASFIGVTYFEIVKHAFLPAIISYIALFYISHLEALKLGLKGLEEKDLPTSEDAELNPMSPYALQKLIGEQYCKLFSEVYNLETVCLRYFNVFGRRQDPNGAYAAVIPLFVKQFMNYESPVINGTGDFSRDFTYIDNVIQMNEKAMLTENQEALNTVYNTAVGDRTTLNELVNYLKQFLTVLDPKIEAVEIKHGPNRKGDIPHSLASIEKAQKLLGYEPTHKIKEGLKEAVSWYWENLK